MYNQVLEGLVRTRISALALDSDNESFPGEFLSTDDAWNSEDVPDIVFSVAGSGKTQRLFNQLTKVNGHYLVSGRVPDGESTSNTVIKPHLGLASLDTKYLCTILDKILPPDGGPKWLCEQVEGEVSMSREAWSILLHNRQMTFVKAQQWAKANGRSTFSPYDWLVFQTICKDGFDPFLKSLKILSLIDDWDETVHCEDAATSKSGGLSRSLVSRRHSDTKLPICFDEAQCEISEGRDDRSNHSFAGLLTRMYRRPTNYKSSKIDFPFRFVTAGTSLQLQQIQSIVENAINDPRQDYDTYFGVGDSEDSEDYTYQEEGGGTKDLSPSKRMHRAKVFSGAKLVGNDNDFARLLDQHASRIIQSMEFLSTIHKATSAHHLWDLFALESPEMTREQFYTTARDHLSKHSRERLIAVMISRLYGTGQRDESEVRKLILSHGRFFRGRVRWSIVFVEQLLVKYLTEVGENSDNIAEQLDAKEVIRAAATTAENIVIKQLQARIDELKGRGHYLLLRDLYFTAVRADLMNKPCIFMDTESAQMVTEGFALLKPSSDNADGMSLSQELSEPLTIRAIVQYLRKPETIAGQTSRHTKILDQMLFDVQDSHTSFGEVTEYYLGWSFAGLMSGQTVSTERSSIFRALLGKAKLVARAGPLVPGNKTKIGDLDEYFLHEPQMVKEEGEMGQNFEFDDWLNRIRTSRYFPAVYFPPQAAGPDIVFYLRHKERANEGILCALQVKTAPRFDEASYFVLRTLDPNLWFTTNTKKRPLFLEELARHSNLKILTGLVTPAVSSADFLAPSDIITQGLQNLKEWVQRYNVLANPEKLVRTKSVLPSWVSDAEQDFKQAEVKFASKADKKLRTDALEYIRADTRQKQAEGALLVLQQASRWLRVEPEKMECLGAPIETAPGIGHDFFFTTFDHTDLPRILGDNYAQLSKAMKVAASKKEKRSKALKDA